MKGGGVGPRCSFCGTTDGPFLEVGGGFPLLMCEACQDARAASGTAGLLEPPAELLAHRDPGEPWLEWGCPIEGCTYRVALPWWLEEHTAAEHPEWTATYELVRLLPRQVLRVVYRRATRSGLRRRSGGRLAALLIGDAAACRGLILVVAVVDDLQDHDGAERGAEAAEGRELVGGRPVPRGP